MKRAPNCARMVLANTANTSNRSYLQNNKTMVDNYVGLTAYEPQLLHASVSACVHWKLYGHGNSNKTAHASITRNTAVVNHRSSIALAMWPKYLQIQGLEKGDEYPHIYASVKGAWLCYLYLSYTIHIMCAVVTCTRKDQ